MDEIIAFVRSSGTLFCTTSGVSVQKPAAKIQLFSVSGAKLPASLRTSGLKCAVFTLLLPLATPIGGRAAQLRRPDTT
ncbi:MAG: hypothetical protein ACI353_07660 [Alloprevotella sp.]